ncbi:MAG: hypothetical protein ACOYOU_10770 [Kiritimatiellia bacterium]
MTGRVTAAKESQHRKRVGGVIVRPTPVRLLLAGKKLQSAVNRGRNALQNPPLRECIVPRQRRWQRDRHRRHESLGKRGARQ